MPVCPKRKTSKSRSRMRRAHRALTAPNLVPCSQCHALMRPHRVCPSCGTYNGRQIAEA